ncbi:hypothetical protein GCM10026982_37630 [Nocardiopsis aegyptia]
MKANLFCKKLADTIEIKGFLDWPWLNYLICMRAFFWVVFFCFYVDLASCVAQLKKARSNFSRCLSEVLKIRPHFLHLTIFTIIVGAEGLACVHESETNPGSCSVPGLGFSRRLLDELGYPPQGRWCATTAARCSRPGRRTRWCVRGGVAARVGIDDDGEPSRLTCFTTPSPPRRALRRDLGMAGQGATEV